jgi:hypothetical protein
MDLFILAFAAARKLAFDPDYLKQGTFYVNSDTFEMLLWCLEANLMAFKVRIYFKIKFLYKMVDLQSLALTKKPRQIAKVRVSNFNRMIAFETFSGIILKYSLQTNILTHIAEI